MTKTTLLLTFSLLTISSFAQVKKPATAAKPATTGKPAAKPAAKTGTTVNPFKSNADSISYAVGLRIAQSLKGQGFDNINMTLFEKAMGDFKQNKPSLLSDEAIQQCITTFQIKANEAKAKENAGKSAATRKEGLDFLAQNGKRAGVVTLPSGLQYEILKAGTDNTKPTINSKVKCHYTGTLLNGTKFDSSVDRGEPITFPLGNVIRGWQEGLQLMTVGSKWKLYVPADMGYGDNPPPGVITPGATLVFEVELLGIEN